MKFAFTAYGPIEANDRIGAFKMANGLIEEIEKRTGQKFTVTVHGPIDNDHRAPDPRAEAHRSEGAGPAAEGPHPGDDFPDEDAGAEGAEPAAGEGRVRGDDGEPEPKRRRGRPPGSGKAAGKAAGGSEQGSDAERPARAPEAGDGNEHGRTAQGKGQERGRAHEGARGAGAAPAAAERDRGSDQGEAGLTAEADEWDDAEPAYVLSDVTKAMTALYIAMGGEDAGVKRKDVSKVVEEFTGFSQYKDIPEEAFAKTISMLEREAKAYTSGKKTFSA